MDDGDVTLSKVLMQHSEEVLGVMLTCTTGLLSVLGALVVYSSRLDFLWQPQSLVVALGVATGGMMSFTFIELVPEAQLLLEDVVKKLLKRSTNEPDQVVEGYATLLLAAAFATGVFAIWAIDTLCVYCVVPTKLVRSSRDATVLIRNGGSATSPSTIRGSSPTRTTNRAQPLMLPSTTPDFSAKELLYKTGTARVVAFGLQNVPEGMVLCIAANQRKTLGILFACALAMLNLTQGMALAGILAQSSGLRWRAVLWCVLAALGLPLGGFLAWAVIFKTYLTSLVLGVLYSVTCGLLVGTSFSQILTVCYIHEAASDSSSAMLSVLGGIVFTTGIRMALAFLYV